MYGIPDTQTPVPPPQPPTVVEHLDWYLGHLWTLIWRVCCVANAVTPIGVLVMRRVGAAHTRFRALLERLKFGPLPPPADSDDGGRAFRLKPSIDSDPRRTGIPSIPARVVIGVVMGSDRRLGVKHHRLGGA